MVGREPSRVLFVVVIVGMVSLIGVQATFNEKPSSVPFPRASTAGVTLQVSVNATTLHRGQKLNIIVSLFNNLAVLNYLRTADNWTVRGFPIAIWPGCLSPLPVDFTILKGNLSLTQIEALGNGTGARYTCFELVSVDHVVFQPKSSLVTLTGTYMGGVAVPNQVSGPYRLVSNFTVNGYWDYPVGVQESDDLQTPYDGGFTFRYPEVGPLAAYAFAPGVYTLIVSDEWSGTAMLHFLVTQ